MGIEILAPTNLHLDIHEGILEFDLYICIWSASRIDLQEPPVASSWPDIIFEMRIEILTLTNLHLDIHEGILEFDLYICIWSASSSLQDQPPAASRWPITIFDMRIEILTLTNLHLDIHEGILEFDRYISI